MSDYGQDEQEKATRKKPGRPARELGQWSVDEHEEFQRLYRMMHIGYNKRSRDEVDEWAEKLIEYVNQARGIK